MVWATRGPQRSAAQCCISQSAESGCWSYFCVWSQRAATEASWLQRDGGQSCITASDQACVLLPFIRPCVHSSSGESGFRGGWQIGAAQSGLKQTDWQSAGGVHIPSKALRIAHTQGFRRSLCKGASRGLNLQPSQCFSPHRRLVYWLCEERFKTIQGVEM